MAPVATILGPDEQLAHAGSAGRPVLNVETRIVDDHDQPLPPGTVGEIVHRSPQATLGYYKTPRRQPRPSAAAGSTPATSATSTTTDYSPSSTARRT